MHRHLATLLVLAAATASLPAAAEDAPRPESIPLADSIESCVDATTLRFAPGERRALVDAHDTITLAEAFLRRYPAFAQASPPPDAVALWEKPGSGWVYLALMAKADKPGERCFTASFAAARFGETEGLLKKYFGVPT